MTDRQEALRRLAADLREREAIDDVFLAKSFTDRLLIVDVKGDRVPENVVTRLDEYDLRAADSVCGEAQGNPSAVGDVGDATRHHFVDVRTRGTHQSYVVD